MREQQVGAYAGGPLGELVGAWLSFDEGLRSGSGFDVEAYERLRRVLRGCAVAWAGCDAVPREGVNVLVDVFPATEANARLYEGEVADQVMEAAYELHALVVPASRCGIRTAGGSGKPGDRASSAAAPGRLRVWSLLRGA
ncbi:hypothetical protein [Streptomyces sp. R33]|uniref:Uncharacterized protein n=1 Tax=Streptomyces sp. R33 TaxID=3238629 RepID=A0AB39XVX9_9ACTN